MRMTEVVRVVLQVVGDHGQVKDEWVSMVLPKITYFYGSCLFSGKQWNTVAKLP